jgi:WD40 repeat protein
MLRTIPVLGILWTAWILAIPIPVAAQAPAPAVDFYGDSLPTGAVARLGTTRFRSPDYVLHLAFSPDGKRLVTHGQTKIALWDVETGKKLAEFASEKVGALAWRGDGRGVMLVTEPGGKERIGDFTRERLKALPFDPNRGAVAELQGATAKIDHERFHGHAISPDGKYLVAGRTGNRDDRARSISVWEIDPARPLEEFEQIHELGPQEGNCHQIIFSPEGKYVGVVSGPKLGKKPDQSVLFVLYDLATGKERYRRTIPISGRNDISAIALAPEARSLAIGLNDSAPRVYPIERDGPEITVDAPGASDEGAHRNPFLFSGDQLWAVRGRSMVLNAYDTKTGRALRSPTPLPTYVSAMALAPNGKRLALAGGGVIAIVDTDTGRLLAPAAGHIGWITGLHVSPDGANVLTWDHRGEARIWDVANGKPLLSLPAPQSEKPPRQLVGQLIISPDEKAILALNEGRLQALDAATGKPLPAPGGLAGATATAVTRGADRHSVILSDDTSVSVWDWPSGRLRHRIGLEPDPVLAKLESRNTYEPRRFYMTPDAKQLVSRGLLDVVVWDLETGASATLWRGNSIMHMDSALTFVGGGTKIAFSGTFSLAANGDEGVGGAGVKGKKAVAPLPAPGKKAKGGGGDNPFGNQAGFGLKMPAKNSFVRGIALWDLRSGKLLHVCDDEDSPRDIASDPGGYVLAAAQAGRYDNEKIVLFEVATGQIRRRFSDAVRETSALAFTPDGHRLVSVSYDTTGLVWHMNLLALARGRKPASDADLEHAWTTIAEPNARAAYDALLAFASNPERAIALLQNRLRPIPMVGAATFDRILADLEDEKFLTRERAANELEKLARVGVAAIRARLDKAKSREAKVRLTQYLDKYDSPKMTADELRSLRALEFLEHAGTPAALSLIAELSSGEPTAEFTTRASEAKKRLTR